MEGAISLSPHATGLLAVTRRITWLGGRDVLARISFPSFTDNLNPITIDLARVASAFRFPEKQPSQFFVFMGSMRIPQISESEMVTELFKLKK